MNKIKNQAQALLSQGKTEKALAMLNKISKKKPRDAENWATLGFVYAEKGNYDLAVTYLKKSLSLAPDAAYSYRVCRALGALLEARGQYAEAIIYYKKTLNLSPTLASIYMDLGACLEKERRSDEAVDIYKKLLALDPKNYQAYRNIAQIYEQSHQLQDARNNAELALKIAPNDIQTNFLVAQLDLRDKKNDLARSRLVELVKMNMSVQHKAVVTKELAKVLEKEGEYQEAFSLIDAANKMFESVYKEQKDEANKEDYRKEVDAYRQSFTAESISNWPDKPPTQNDLKIVFLVGFPRSGTTLTEQILESHPDFIATHELPVLPRITKDISKIIKRPFSYPVDVSSLTNDEVVLLRAEYLSRMGAKLHCVIDTDKYLLDKLPLNIVHLGFIARVFPEARILVALRDPRDVCLSCFTQTFNLNQAMRQYLDINDTAKFYACVMGLWLHYRDVLNIHMLETRYEDIVDDLEVAAKRILEFIGVAWHDDVLSFYDSAKKRQVFTPSYQGVTQPIYRGAINKWRNYENELASSMPALDSFIREFGYSVDI